MIEVVATVLLVGMLPREDRVRLMLHHDTFLELSVVVAARVTTILRDLERIKLLLHVLLGHVGINVRGHYDK